MTDPEAMERVIGALDRLDELATGASRGGDLDRKSEQGGTDAVANGGRQLLVCLGCRGRESHLTDEPDDDPIEMRRPEGPFGPIERPFGEGSRTGEVPCPRCGSTIDPVPVVYGYPSAETFAEAEAGRVRLGGCLIEPEAPDFRCPICDAALPMVAESWRQ